MPVAGVVLRVALRLVYGARGPADDDVAYATASLVAWVLIVAPMVLLGLLFTVLMFPLMMMLLVAGLDALALRRSFERRVAWGVVRQGADGAYPLPAALLAQTDRFHGSVARQVERFAEDLAQGAALPDAVARRRLAFPPEAQGQAALAKQGGLSLRPDPGEPAEGRPWNEAPPIHAGAYAAWVLTTSMGVVTFLAIKIVPEFIKIFSEFSIELPTVTLSAFALTRWVSGGPLGLLATALLMVVMLSFGGWMLGRLLQWRSLERLGERLFDTPQRAEALGLLARAMDHRMPLEETLGRLTEGSPRIDSPRTAGRLRRVARSLDAGENWKQALAAAGLVGRQDVPLLHAAEHAGNLPWALRSIAQRDVGRDRFRWRARLGVLFPVGVVLLGLLVAWIVIGLFLPLVKLIEGLV